MSKEAKARIKINKLLEEAGWRLIDDSTGPANVLLENNVRITKELLNDLGEDFEKTRKGFIDYLLLDIKGFLYEADRRLSLREIIEKVFGFIPYFKSKDELMEDEFDKFDSRYLPDEKVFDSAKNYFKSYITDPEFREIIEQKKYALLNTNPNGNVFRQLPPELRSLIPEYIKDNISLNQFMA